MTNRATLRVVPSDLADLTLDLRKHYLGLSDNVTFVPTQLEGIDASVYRTRIVLKPQNLVPNFDLVTGRSRSAGLYDVRAGTVVL